MTRRGERRENTVVQIVAGLVMLLTLFLMFDWLPSVLRDLGL